MYVYVCWGWVDTFNGSLPTFHERQQRVQIAALASDCLGLSPASLLTNLGRFLNLSLIHSYVKYGP